ncbi:MAG TPA: ATP-binding protein [Terrimicrobiaceae bacterium]
MNISPYIEWTPQHIGHLFDARVKESRTLEYKRDMPNTRGEGLKELLADVSAFANSSGGVIVFGVDERESEPSDCVGVQITDSVNEKLRLEQTISANLDPNLRGCRFDVIATRNGKTILALRIPANLNAPHMIRTGSPKFFFRGSAGKIPMDSYDIRAAFLSSEGLAQKVSCFRKRRCDAIRKGEIRLDPEESGWTVFHILPLSAFQRPRHFSMRELQTWAKDMRPLRSYGGWTHEISLDGYAVCSPGSAQAGKCSYSMVFREACIEAVMPCVHTNDKGRRIIQERAVIEALQEAIPAYLRMYAAMEVTPPFLFSLSYLGVGDAVCYIPTQLLSYCHGLRPIATSTLLLPFYETDEGEPAPDRILTYFSDLLANASGLSSSIYFDKTARI